MGRNRDGGRDKKRKKGKQQERDKGEVIKWNEGGRDRPRHRKVGKRNESTRQRREIKR